MKKLDVKLREAAEAMHGQLKDKAGIISRSIHASDDERDRHGVWLSLEDAALIVAAVNALPALLDISEAAQSVQDGQDMRDEDETEWAAAGTRVSAMEMHERRMCLARALSLLPNTKLTRPADDVAKPGPGVTGSGLATC